MKWPFLGFKLHIRLFQANGFMIHLSFAFKMSNEKISWNNCGNARLLEGSEKEKFQNVKLSLTGNVNNKNIFFEVFFSDEI